MDLVRFRRKPLLGILRGISAAALEPLLDVAVESGLETIEIAMNTEGAAGLIQRAARFYPRKLTVGAGTVLNMADLRTALRAGASFVVSPVLVKSVVRYCVREKIPVFPGALIPSDIYAAWRAGATMVKVFPAGCFEPDYFRELKGPFPKIELLACAGVTPANIKDYFSNGASAVAIGGSVFRKEWIRAGKFGLIRKKIQRYLLGLPPRTGQK